MLHLLPRLGDRSFFYRVFFKPYYRPEQNSRVCLEYIDQYFHPLCPNFKAKFLEKLFLSYLKNALVNEASNTACDYSMREPVLFLWTLNVKINIQAIIMFFLIILAMVKPVMVMANGNVKNMYSNVTAFFLNNTNGNDSNTGCGKLNSTSS